MTVKIIVGCEIISNSLKDIDLITICSNRALHAEGRVDLSSEIVDGVRESSNSSNELRKSFTTKIFELKWLWIYHSSPTSSIVPELFAFNSVTLSNRRCPSDTRIC